MLCDGVMFMITSPLKAIKAKCMDCTCQQYNEVKFCTIENCPLFPFRLGKNPYSKREMTEDQRRAAAERLRKARENKRENNIE